MAKICTFEKLYLTLRPLSNLWRGTCMLLRIHLINFIFFMESLLKYVQDNLIAKKDFPDFSTGDTITVYYEIKEGEKSRVQFFRGVVIQRRGTGATETFTIRKMSGEVGVERIFPINMPAIQKIEVNKYGKVRRARIYYYRELRGKKARIKEIRK